MKKNVKKLTKDTYYQVSVDSDSDWAGVGKSLNTEVWVTNANSSDEAIKKIKSKVPNGKKYSATSIPDFILERNLAYMKKRGRYVDSKTKDFGNEQNVRFAVCYEDENGEEMYASLPMRSDIETKSAAQDYFEKWMRKHGEKYSRIKWVEYFKGYKPYDMVLDKKAKDSDKLKSLAYKFAQMGSYFDRANSARSREFLAKEDDKKYPEFLRLAFEVLNQLKIEVEGMKSAKTLKGIGYFASYDNQTLSLLNDAISRLYWAASDRVDAKGKLLSQKLEDIYKEYKRLAVNGKRDSKAKDALVGTSSEHEPEWEKQIGIGNWKYGDFYGYFRVEHPKLGEFYVSFRTKDGKIRTDNFPWKNIGHLNSAQIDWVNKHEKELTSICKKGGYNKFVPDSKKTKDNESMKIKNCKKKYAIVILKKWNKYKINAEADYFVNDLEEARRLKNSLSMHDNDTFVIIDCNNNYKVIYN